MTTGSNLKATDRLMKAAGGQIIGGRSWFEKKLFSRPGEVSLGLYKRLHLRIIVLLSLVLSSGYGFSENIRKTYSPEAFSHSRETWAFTG